jgi:hypothetical protein
MLPVLLGKDNKLATQLDLGSLWAHDVNHTHYVTIDLLKSRYITQMRFLLNNNVNVEHLKVYVSDDVSLFGDAVLDIADWTSYTKDDEEPYRYEGCTPKVGRYVYIEILSTHDANNYLRWG